MPVREIRGITSARHRRAISLQLDVVNAKILEIERVPLVAAREVGVTNQTNYDQVWICASKIVVEVNRRLVCGNGQVLYLYARIVMPHILQLEKLHVRL